MRAAIYERISDDREGRELGVDRQDKDCRALAAREGLAVVQVYRDNDQSASTKASKPRKQFNQMIRDARDGKFGVIISYTSSRLTRKPRENEDLIDLAIKYGIRFAYVRSPEWNLNTADGREYARMAAARDAAEAERVSERVVREVLARAERQEFHGGPRPFGIAAKGRELVEDEAAMIRAWYEHILAGGSLSSIRIDLNRAGVPSTTGKEWRTPVIRRILLHPRNAGLRIHNEIEYVAPNPAIVPEQTWRAARRLLEDPARRTHGLGPARKHVGTGVFECVRCDRTVNSGYDQRNRLLYRCLRCFRSWLAGPIHGWIDAAIEERLSVDNDRERILPKSASNVDVGALRTEATAIRENMAWMAAQCATAKGPTREALMAGLRTGEERLAEIQDEVTEAGRVDVGAALLASDDPVATYRAIKDVARKQAIIRMMAVIRLGAPIRGRVAWNPGFMGESRWTGDELTWGQRWAPGGV